MITISCIITEGEASDKLEIRWMKLRKKEGHMRDGYLPLVCKAAVISIVLLLTGCGGNYKRAASPIWLVGKIKKHRKSDASLFLCFS